MGPDQDEYSAGQSVLIWVQTVCKGYQQTTKVASKERVTQHTVKPVVNSQSQKDRKWVLKTNYRLLQV